MPENKQEVSFEKRSLLYEFVRYLGHVVFRTLMPVKCVHRERLDREAPYLLISNHLSALDPVVLAMHVSKRQVCFLAKRELAKNKLLKKILTSVHTILVDRHGTDMAAMRSCMKAIRAKKILVIFPEGTRHHEGQMQQIESGASLIAMRCGAPIIPVYFDRKISFFKRTHMYVGEAISCADLVEKGINSETCEEMNERFRATFREMIRAAEAEKAKK